MCKGSPAGSVGPSPFEWHFTDVAMGYRPMGSAGVWEGFNRGVQITYTTRYEVKFDWLASVEASYRAGRVGTAFAFFAFHLQHVSWCNRSIYYTTVNHIDVFPILEESNGSSTPMRTGSQHSDGS